MEIEPKDWQRVVEAFERGERAEQGQLAYGETLLADWRGDWPFHTGVDDARVRRELRQLKRMLSKCHNETLVWIEASLNGPLLEAVDDAIRSMSINLRPGRAKPYRYLEAVAVLRELWPDNRHPGVRYGPDGQPSFNPFVRWLGSNLKRLDPENLRADEVACLAAWNALTPPAARPRKRRTTT